VGYVDGQTPNELGVLEDDPDEPDEPESPPLFGQLAESPP
jgi:hypothetical protein